jgi:riboflavin kinase/FMN adenylyltransferase
MNIFVKFVCPAQFGPSAVVFMELIPDWGRQPSGPRPRTVFTIGVFDGLHRGHRGLINLALKEAARLKARAMVLTFAPHPLAVLAPDAAPPLLTTVEHKAAVLADWGLDCLGILSFSRELAVTEPLKFLSHLVARFIDPAAVVLGPDFAFGRDAQGGPETIRLWLAGLSPRARLLQVEPVAGDSGLLSSSQIRQELKEGLVERATRDLGRHYRLSGTVVHGQARGRALGFPTANLGRIRQLVPGPGVYATRVHLDGRAWPGMTSIGHNPTFGDKGLTVETNILDFDQFIYGKNLDLDFVARLRPMIRFESAEHLARQLDQDRESARACF